MSTVIRDAYVVTMDSGGREIEDGWVKVSGGFVEEVGSGAAPDADETIRLGGRLLTPALINTHHHLYQTLTRARAQEADLFTWLRTLYPVWGRLDAEAQYAAARTGLAELALSGCATVFDHHYLFPAGTGGLDLRFVDHDLDLTHAADSTERTDHVVSDPGCGILAPG